MSEACGPYRTAIPNKNSPVQDPCLLQPWGKNCRCPAFPGAAGTRPRRRCGRDVWMIWSLDDRAEGSVVYSLPPPLCLLPAGAARTQGAALTSVTFRGACAPRSEERPMGGLDRTPGGA